MSATVTPRWNAATLMRPRSSDVTSIVNRAVKAPFFAAASVGASDDLIRLSTSPGREANWLRRGRAARNTDDTESFRQSLAR